jgi:hypothetical protein
VLFIRRAIAAVICAVLVASGPIDVVAAPVEPPPVEPEMSTSDVPVDPSAPPTTQPPATPVDAVIPELLEELEPLPAPVMPEATELPGKVAAPGEVPAAPKGGAPSDRSVPTDPLPAPTPVAAATLDVTLDGTTSATTTRVAGGSGGQIVRFGVEPNAAEPSGSSSPEDEADSAGKVVAGPAVSAELAVSVLSTEQAAEAGLEWLGFRIRRSDTGKLNASTTVTIDYSSFRYAYGGQWADRLQLIRLNPCETPRCEPRPEVMRTISNDVENGLLTVALSIPPANAGPASAGLGLSGPSAGGSDTFGLSSGTGGSQGDWGASSLTRAGQWAQTGADGGFSWSYPISLPQALAGVVPGLSLGYGTVGKMV